MNIQNKLIFSVFISVFLIAASITSSRLLAVDVSTGTAPLKEVMQQLLEDTKLLTEALISEDYKLIAESADRIANHQMADKETRMKLAKSFGPEMMQFKGFDMKVHNAATEINKDAVTQDMNSILTNYSILIKGCQSCHNSFKERAITVLKAK